MILSPKTQLIGDFFHQACRKPSTLGDAGQAIVEFALIAPAFFGLLLGIFEFSGVMFAQTLLEGGARQASRYGITGSATVDVTREDMILQIIGDNAYGIIDTDEIEMDTLVYDKFSDVAQPEPFTDANNNGIFDEGEEFEDVNGNTQWDEDQGRAGLGDAGEVVVYRLRYDWPLIVPFFRPLFGDSFALDANVAVRNEPFGS